MGNRPPGNIDPARKWIGDGSKGSTLTVAGSSDDGARISFASARKGTPFNIRLASGSIGNMFYEVTVIELQEGSLSVGLVAEKEFRPGWKTRGCFFNGNLTNGSAGLLIGFGDHIKVSDKVGIYLQRTSSNDTRSKIIFYLNDRCLGTGFSIDSNVVFYPCLNLSGSATVQFTVPDDAFFPTVLVREPFKSRNDDPYIGDWVVKAANAGPELGELPLPPNAEVKVKFSRANRPYGIAHAYEVGVQVANQFHTILAVKEKIEAFDKIEIACPCATTKMMPPPHLQPLEQFIGSALDESGGFSKMKVSDSGDLVISGPTAEITCARYNQAFDPLTSY